MKQPRSSLLASVLRWVLGGVLVWAAVSKLANLQDFYGALIAYKLPLPDALLRAVAMSLPWLEMLCGLMLVTKVRIEAALGWSVILFFVFAVATAQAWARGLDISCGCLDLQLLGISSTSKIFESVGFAFVRAAFLAAGAIYVLRHCLTVEEAS